MARPLRGARAAGLGGLVLTLFLSASSASADAAREAVSCNAAGDVASRFVLLLALLVLYQRGKTHRR